MMQEQIEAAIQTILPMLQELKAVDAAWRDKKSELRLAFHLGIPGELWRRLPGEQLVQLAEYGDADADRLLRRIAAGMIEEGHGLPSFLGRFVANILRSGEIARKRKPGPDRRADTMRKIFIIAAVVQVVELGFAPTRNIATKSTKGTESACSIVAQALGRVGRHTTEASVNKIWSRRSPV